MNPEFFDQRNVQIIKNRISDILSNEFRQKIIYDDGSIKRVMISIYEQRFESVQRMNERVVMELCREFRNEQYQVNKIKNLEENFRNSQLNIDPVGRTQKFDSQSIKTTDKPDYTGNKKVGGTLRFYFT